ncbi:hypothetical protein RUND412_006897 [Rhizina undulata]
MLLTFLLSTFLQVFYLTVGVSAYSDPGSCTPTASCHVHDPAVIKRTSDGTYFRFSTGNEIQIATASALSGPWTIQGSALPDGSSIDLSGNTDLWAPDVIKIGDYYYLYYAVSTFGSQASAIGVARSTTMEVGSWTDLGSAGVTSASGDSYNAIDPSIILAEDSNYYLTFGSFWADIYQVEMASTPTATAGGTPYQVAYNSSGTHAVEGSYVYYRSGYYYLFFSSGQCCGYDTSKPTAGNEYRINVCRSTEVSGSYVDADGVSCTAGGGTTVLASHGTVYGPGGQGVFADSDSGGTILYYHYVDTTIGYADGDKVFGWNVLSWSDGWPTV